MAIALPLDMSSREPNIAVIGGGITGLAAAFYLRKLRPAARITLFESGSRLGGNIRTERREQFLVDAGPDSFIAGKPAAMNLCRELGLSGELIRPRTGARRRSAAGTRAASRGSGRTANARGTAR